MNKDTRFFIFSALFHAGVIGVFIALPSFQQEEEITLTLDLSTQPAPPQQQEQPQPQKVTPQPVVEKPKEVVKKEPVPNPVYQKATPPPPPTPVVAPAKPAPVVSQQPSVDVEKEYLEDHLKKIRQLLVENQKYPRNAKLLGQEGEVEVSFRLNGDGSVDAITITKKSGFELLDHAAKELVVSTASRFPKPPKTVMIKLPIKYTLQ